MEEKGTRGLEMSEVFMAKEKAHIAYTISRLTKTHAMWQTHTSVKRIKCPAYKNQYQHLLFRQTDRQTAITSSKKSCTQLINQYHVLAIILPSYFDL